MLTTYEVFKKTSGKLPEGISLSNSGLLYGITSEVKLSKGDSSYYLINYANGEEKWETIGDTATTNNFKVNNNIFLNNTGHEIYFVNPDDTSNVDYNWFGNNATDYEKKPELCNVEASVWLFLNATVNPNPVAIFSSSDIIFKLSAYNKTSPDITHNYDNSLLMPVNLTVNITSGKVDKSVIALNETARFTPSILGKANVTVSIVNAECTIELNCIEANPNLSVESQPITYGENAVINLYYNPNATGVVNITINGSKFNKS